MTEKYTSKKNLCIDNLNGKDDLAERSKILARYRPEKRFC